MNEDWWQPTAHGISNSHAEQTDPYTPDSFYCSYSVMVYDWVVLK